MKEESSEEARIKTTVVRVTKVALKKAPVNEGSYKT